jgi:hypothetical protein
MHVTNDATFLKALTKVLIIISSGKAPLEFATFFAIVPLVPTLKKDENIRLAKFYEDFYLK